MKIDDLIYRLLEQSYERKGGGGKLLAGAALGAAGTYAALNPEKTAGLYKQHVAPHVNKALDTIGGKHAHAAQAPPTHADREHMGEVPRGRTEPPTETQFKEPGPSHAPPHDIDIPDYGV
jgi:hypothetical protein